MCELLPPPATMGPGCCLCLHTSRDGELTPPTSRQGKHLPIPWPLALCSKISPVPRQVTEGPPKEHLLVTWEMDSADL